MARDDTEERALLARWQGGDRLAFQALIRPHVAAMRALAERQVGRGDDADEITQSALIRALEALGGYRAEGSLRAWLFRIVVRVGIDHVRRRGARGPALDLQEVEIPDTFGPAPDAGLMARELRERLQEAMERLSERQRLALHLRAAEGLDYASIAAVLECSANAARMAVLEARRRVRERMGSYLEP